MKINPITIILLCSVLSCGYSGLPKLAEAANLVCDQLQQYDHFKDQVQSVKTLIENGKYEDALIVAKDLYNQYRDFKETEGLKELKSLVTMLETLI